jgi:PAS domain S-box-containing protein
MQTPQELHRLAQMIDSVSDAIVTIDSRGIIEYVNQGALELFGYQRSELLGQNVARLMAPPDSGRHDHYIRAYLKTGQSRVMNHRRSVQGLRRDGSAVPLDLTLGQMMENGEQKFTAIMRDMTQQRRLLQLADDANRAKSVFLATMSHEIRTPMNGVLGALELLALGALDDEQRQTVDMAEQSARELLQLLDDILDFSKIEAGRLELRQERTAVREQIVDKVIATFAPLAEKKGLRLHSSVGADVAGHVCTDPLRLRQVLHNFVSNAVKFTPAGSIELTLDALETAPGRQRLRFSVRDTGIGISAASQARLFKPFVQAEGDTTRRFGGSGLGLAICLGLADSMGATIDMQSTPGQGTTMALTLTLPVLEAPPAPAPSASARQALPRPAGAAGQRVLVADDHATNRKILLRQLEALGYAADSCANGVEALAMLATGRYALLISDCQMPEMDGYTLATTIRAQEGSRPGGVRLPIIAFTANAFPSDAAAVLAAGMDAHLAKPSTMAALAALLQKHMPLPPAPIDEARLADITGGDAALRAELLQDFRNTNLEDVGALRTACAAADRTAIRHNAHRIRGASRMVGAAALAEACAAIEQALREADSAAPPQLAEALARFDTELDLLHRYID